jgi:hypothetical protein
MTTVNNDLPVPIIESPRSTEPAKNKVFVRGRVAGKEGDRVTVHRAGTGQALLTVDYKGSNEWSGTLTEDLTKGPHSITARLTRGKEYSSFSPTQQFIVE